MLYFIHFIQGYQTILQGLKTQSYFAVTARAQSFFFFAASLQNSAPSSSRAACFSCLEGAHKDQRPQMPSIQVTPFRTCPVFTVENSQSQSIAAD